MPMCTIYLIFEYSLFRFFKDHELGNWDLMIDGLINVSNSMSLKRYRTIAIKENVHESPL